MELFVTAISHLKLLTLVKKSLRTFKQICTLVTDTMFYSNMSLKKIVIHDINATPHWSFLKYLTLKMELFVKTINCFKLLVKKSSILNKPVFKKTWIRETGFANIRLVMKKFIITIFT